MLWRDVISLVGQTSSDNGMGDTVYTPYKREVFANKKSVRQSEFYQAQANGLKPELMFEIRYIEYQDEQSIEYNGKPYTIIRQFSKNEEVVELICEGVVNRGTT
jgi:SPP1 family predicted phage head-tail adaptor